MVNVCRLGKFPAQRVLPTAAPYNKNIHLQSPRCWLVTEMSHACKYHGHSCFIGSGNDFVISN